MDASVVPRPAPTMRVAAASSIAGAYRPNSWSGAAHSQPVARVSARVKRGAKDAALKLIDHEDEDVQRRALQCVSKILLRGGSVAVGGA